MEYSFNIQEAIDFGVNEAIFLKNLRFWIAKNKANRTHLYEVQNYPDLEGEYRTWTYNSVSAYNELFPFFTPKQMRTIIENLLNANVIIKGNYHENKSNRSNWYAFKDEQKFLYNHLPNLANDLPKKANDLPYKANDLTQKANGYHILNTDNKPNNYLKNKKENFENFSNSYSENERPHYAQSFIYSTPDEMKKFFESTMQSTIEQMKMKYGANIVENKIKEFTETNFQIGYSSESELKRHFTNFLKKQDVPKVQSTNNKKVQESTKESTLSYSGTKDITVEQLRKDKEEWQNRPKKKWTMEEVEALLNKKKNEKQ